MIELTLPYPPSVNRYWRSVKGRVLISKEGREYRDEVCELIGNGYPTYTLPVAVEINAYMPDKRRRDLDNILKALLDALTHAGVIADDALIDRLILTRAGLDRTGGRIELTLQHWIGPHAIHN